MGYQQQVWGAFVGRNRRSLWRLVGLAATQGQIKSFIEEYYQVLTSEEDRKKLVGRARAVPLGTRLAEEQIRFYAEGVRWTQLDELCTCHRKSKEEEAIFVRRTQGLSQKELLRRCRKLARKGKGRA